MSIPSVTESLYVNGEWRRATGPIVNLYSPADGSVIAEVPSATEQEVHQALEAARIAQPGWAHLSSIERGLYLRKLVDLVAANASHLAELIVEEMGKPRKQADGELNFAISLLRYSSEWDRRLEGEILPGDVPGEEIHLTRAPIGVVAAICPWNFPLAVLCRKLGPALITGNALVVKPSEISPLSTIELFRLIDAHLGLPSGVLNLVTGAAVTGQAIVNDDTTEMVSFTGHRDTGKQIMEAASKHLTRVALELGGKAPAIVWRDADLEVAVPAIIAARHTNAGQVCTAAERVFVHRDVYEPFVDRYVAAVQALSVGDPKTDVDMGPLASEQQLTKARTALDIAVREGVKVAVRGGAAPFGVADGGYWFSPSVLLDVDMETSVMREETFGPITPIRPIERFDEVVGSANDSRYGLSAYIYSSDYQMIMRAVEDLRFGEIFINRTAGESVHAHHSGYRESGIGGEDGKWGLLRYTQIKTAYHHYG